MADISFKNPTKGALYMFERGCKVFPVNAEDKTPAVKGWQQWARKATAKKILQYGTANTFTNWGVSCDDLIVIDIDNKAGKDGSENFKKLLKAENKSLPATFMVRTPTGGYHVYFQGECKNSVGLVAGDVDVRSSGGYVVAPGSRIEEREYEVLSESSVAAIPEWFLYLVNSKAAKEPLLLSDETVVPEGTRDDTITRIAGGMRRYGLSYDAILVALQVENLRICNPPLDDESVKRIAYSVSKYSPETAKAIQDFSTIEQSETLPAKIADFYGPPPKRRWIIKDWLPEGEISSLYGSGGQGKSLLALQLAVAVASGTTFIGREVVTPMPALAVFCEDSHDELHRRLHDIRRAAEFDFMDQTKAAGIPLLLWPRVGMVNDLARISAKGNDVVEGPFRAILTGYLMSMSKGPKLLILDTLSDVYLGDENIRERVNKFIKTHIGSLVKEYELTVLMLAHPSRTGKNTGDMLSGSTAWENSVRNRLAMMPHKSFEGITVLKRMKANYAKSGEEIFLQWEKGRFRVADITLVAEAAMSEENKDVSEVVTNYIGDEVAMPLYRVAKQLHADKALAHLFSGAGVTSIERVIMRAFQYPVARRGRLYWYEEKDKDEEHELLGGKKVTRWMMSKVDDRPAEDRIEAQGEVEALGPELEDLL